MESNQVQKSSSLMGTLGTVMKYSAYIMLAIKCLQMFIEEAQKLSEETAN